MNTIVKTRGEWIQDLLAQVEESFNDLIWRESRHILTIDLEISAENMHNPYASDLQSTYAYIPLNHFGRTLFTKIPIISDCSDRLQNHGLTKRGIIIPLSLVDIAEISVEEYVPPKKIYEYVNERRIK